MRRRERELHTSVGEEILSCRRLAESLRTDAEARRRYIDGRNRRLILDWADQMDEIADRLEQAMGSRHLPGLLSWSTAARCVAGGVLFVSGGVAGGFLDEVGSDLHHHVFGDDSPITKVAESVKTTSSEAVDRIVEYQEHEDYWEIPPLAEGQEVSDRPWFPSVLRTIRGRLGLPQQDVADIVGVSQPAVSNWELGATRPRNRRAVVYELAPLLRDHRDLLVDLANSLGVEVPR